MITLEYLRHFRIFEYAIFDIVVSYLGIYLLSGPLSKLFLKMRLIIPKISWIYLTLPIGIISHLLVGTITPMTRNFLDLNSNYLLKVVIFIMIYLGVRLIELSPKNNNNPELQNQLIKDRDIIFENVKNLFKESCIESHLIGSFSSGSTDAFSDIDIWFTFKDEDIYKIINDRHAIYSSVGEIISICEPPQNAPLGGVHSSVIYKTSSGYTVVDFYLCPLSTSHITKVSKKLHGVDLPKREMEFNQTKVPLPESYRLDFLIIFITVAIKSIIRNKKLPLSSLYKEYDNLSEKYEIKTLPLNNRDHNFESLKMLINKTSLISNEKQKLALSVISDFINKIQT